MAVFLFNLCYTSSVCVFVIMSCVNAVFCAYRDFFSLGLLSNVPIFSLLLCVLRPLCVCLCVAVEP